MMPADLDWVRDNVLPPAKRDSPNLRVCPCQYGPCGHCPRGQHSHCTTRALAAAGRDLHIPETWITYRSGVVVGPAPTVAVWLADRRCRWICPCDCPAELHMDLPPPVRPPGKSGGNSRTPGPPTPDVEQVGLFELAEVG